MVSAIPELAALDRHDLDFLLSDILHCPVLELPLRRDSVLSQEQSALWQEYVDRLKCQEPPQYILGKAWFYGLELEVNPAVLIPRPETEGLVERALGLLQPGSKVLEIGTGSGAIAIALKQSMPSAEITATDSSEAALSVAKRNAARHNCAIDFIQADLFPPQQDSFGLIVSNPPYISPAEYNALEARVRAWEPSQALLAAEDGLCFYRRILERAAACLIPQGLVCFEHGATQRQGILAIAEAHGFACVEAGTDLAGRERYLTLRHPD